MFTTYPITSAVAKAANAAAYEMRHSSFNTPSFFGALSVARFEISSERKYLKTAGTLSVILDRCEALYFTTYSAFCDLQKSTSFERAPYCSALEIATSSLMLFDFLTLKSGKRSFQEKADLLLSHAERFLSVSRSYRFRALSNCKSIGRALPEIEYICTCDRTVTRSKRLVYAYFRLL